MKELLSAKKFAAESPELYKLFKDYSGQYLAEKRGNEIAAKSFSNIPVDEKESAINKAFMEEVKKRSKTTLEDCDNDIMRFSMNPIVRFFADSIVDKMIDMVIPEVLNSSIGLIAEISYTDWGETASFTLENGTLFNVAEAGYDQRSTEAQELTNQTVTLTATPHMITTRASLFDIMSGRVSLAKYAMKAALAMQAKISNDAWDAFATAAAHSTIPAALEVVTYTDDSAIKLAEKVSAWNMGMKAVFAGTPVALNSLLPTNANYRYTLDDAMVKLGYIPQFKNHDVMVTPQFADYTSTTYGMKLNDDVIYVVSPAADKLVKVVIGASLSVPNEIYGKADLTQEQTIMKAYGVKAASNAIAGRIDI